MPVLRNQAAEGDPGRPEPRANRNVHRSEISDRCRPEGAEEVEAGGGRVVSVPLEPGFSTTTLVDELHRRALLANASGLGDASESGSSE